MLYSDVFLVLFGVLSTACGVYSLHSGRFRSVEYEDMHGPAAAFWGMVWMAFGIALCASVLFDIDVLKVALRWFLEMSR